MRAVSVIVEAPHAHRALFASLHFTEPTENALVCNHRQATAVHAVLDHGAAAEAGGRDPHGR